MTVFSFRRSIEPAGNIRALLYVHARHERVMLLKLNGFLDNQNTPAFLSMCRDLLAEDIMVLGFDLQALSYVSSTAVGAFSALSLEAQRHSQLFFLSSVPERITRVLNLLGLGTVIPVIEDPLSYDYAAWI